MFDKLSTKEKMKKYGYTEVYVRVWNPKTEDSPDVLTVNVFEYEEGLNNINSQLYKNISSYYDSSGRDMSGTQEFVGKNLRTLLRNGLIMDAECDNFGINDVKQLESRLNDDDFGVHY
jgi:hypothetical protein